MAPTVVYHYTDARGFAGIVETAKLRATDFRYLNDSQELIYTWDELQRKLGQRVEESDQFSEDYKAALEAFERAKAQDLASAEYSIFISCFSALKDSLNQWTLYADKGSGMALGFDRESIKVIQVPYYQQSATGELSLIRAVNTGQPVTWLSVLQKVRYGDAAREALIRNAMGLIQQVCKPDAITGAEPHKVANLISQITALLLWLPLVKDRAYEYECEWRLTIQEHYGMSPPQTRALSQLGFKEYEAFGQGGLGTLNVEFRQGGSAIFKPYTSLPFDKSALVEVVLGPNLQLPSIESTVRRLLNRYGFRDTEISRSELSYRG